MFHEFSPITYITYSPNLQRLQNQKFFGANQSGRDPGFIVQLIFSSMLLCSLFMLEVREQPEDKTEPYLSRQLDSTMGDESGSQAFHTGFPIHRVKNPMT